MLPIPKKLLEQGVRDMVRISDARMSGTAYGTCVLHVAPESFVGGPLALVQTGDEIALDVPGRRLDLLVAEEELAARRSAWVPREPPATRGYAQLFAAPRHPGQRGLRLRLPARRRRRRRARDPLMQGPWDVVDRRRRHPRPRHRPRAAAPPPRRARPGARARARDRRPPDRPQLRRRPRRHLLRARVAEGPALHRGPREALRLLRRARDRRTSAAASSSSRSTTPSSPKLDELERRGRENGVPGLRRLRGDEIARDRAPRRRRRRPPLAGDGHRRLRRRRPRRWPTRSAPLGATIQTGVDVDRLVALRRHHDPPHLRGPDPRRARAVACAGLWSDRLAVASGEPDDLRIIPFRGGYLKLKPARPPPRASR